LAVVVTLEDDEEVLVALGGAAIGEVEELFVVPLLEGLGAVGLEEGLVGGATVEVKQTADGTWEILNVADGG
jgi:hypothetical protein